MATEVPARQLAEALSRVPTGDKIVGNRPLNLLGCQVGRVIAAEALVRLRRRRQGTPLSPEASQLLQNGIVVIPRFLPSTDFAAVVEESQRAEKRFFKKQPAPDKFGLTRHKISVLKNQEHFPAALKSLLGSARLLDLVRTSEGWSENDDFTNRGTALTYERLEQVVEPAPPSVDRDPEISSGDLHADTFHYVTKAFLTLNAVTVENSPYTYAIGSNRLGLRRIIWEYQNSIRRRQFESSGYHNRVWEAEQKWLRLNIRRIEADQNSVIITNTFGFHFRGPMTKKHAVRKMLRLDFRSDPFGSVR